MRGKGGFLLLDVGCACACPQALCVSLPFKAVRMREEGPPPNWSAGPKIIKRRQARGFFCACAFKASAAAAVCAEGRGRGRGRRPPAPPEKGKGPPAVSCAMDSAATSAASSSCSGSVVGGLAVVHVAFPEVTSALLENLNQQRLEGKLCDIAIHVQGRVFRAHRAVLAASSPYFHDQVLLKNMTSVVLPSVMDPVAFEGVLGSAYTGQLSMAAEEIVNFLTVGSVLQMWHIVDKCTELLKERRGAMLLGAATAPSSSSSSSSSATPCSSSFRAHSSRTSENQSPSSSNYFSPRDSGEGPSEPGKYHSRGALLGGEREASEDHEEEAVAAAMMVFPREKGPPSSRCPDPFAGGSSKFILETDDDASDSGEPGCSSNEGAPGPRQHHRPACLRPSIVPQRQWVFIKKERSQEDLVLTCEEDEDPVEEVEVGPGAHESSGLSITDVRTLTDPGGGGGKLEEQVNFCESSEDFPSPYEGLEEGCPLAGVGGLGAGSTSSFQPRGSLLPMDMQGNHVVVFPASAAASASAPAPAVEHGAVQLAAGSGDGNKIFLCHCGKAFSHKSMRDRHVNMHLNLRPFDCPVCNKKFKMKHHLTEHMKTHTGLKPYECDVCAKKFMWRDSFMRHKGHCERRHRLGNGSGGGSGTTKKEASPSPMEGEWGTGSTAAGSCSSGHSPRNEVSFAGSSKM